MIVHKLLIVLLLQILIHQTNGDQVEELQAFLNNMIQNTEESITVATKLKTEAKAVRDSIYPPKARYINELKEFYSNDSKKYYILRDDVALRTNTAHRKEGLEDLAQVNSKATLDNDFIPILNQFIAFLKKKQESLETRRQAIVDMWTGIQDIVAWVDTTRAAIQQVTIGDADVDRLKKELHLVSRQAQLQQFNEEEKVRSDGNSGIKQIRGRNSGGKNYFQNTHSGRSFAAIHNHANNIRTVGMGEFIGVLNGVEFRTRHNDYSLKKPVENDLTFHKTENIPFPDVPPAVLNKPTPAEQIAEMRLWFKAFADQDHSVRDYRLYFKPVLCYLEGAWTTKNGDNIEESFESDRHFLDAKSWFDLQEKIHFTSYSGTKSKLENLAHLPTTIMDFREDGTPIFAQWNYRILCHQLEKDLPTSYFKLVKDPATQKLTGRDDESYATSRSALFDLKGIKTNGQRSNRPMSYSLLDAIMEEIPGKNNYGAHLIDGGFDTPIESANPEATGADKTLNAAYYHRPYRLKKKDAMGVASAVRGFSDIFYFALTNQSRISGPSFTGKDGDKVSVKGSYAIPIEIIYTTPLSEWNPYGISHDDDKDAISGTGTFADPYTNTVPKLYFKTPSSFFSAAASDSDPADTSSSNGEYFKDSNGNPVNVQASGTRITFPEISGIDVQVRQRYPIMSIYGEGSSVWKKLNALEDSIDFSATSTNIAYYATDKSHAPITTAPPHSHIVQFDKTELEKLKNGDITEIEVFTESAIGHIHQLKVGWNDATNTLYMLHCDSEPIDTLVGTFMCWDSHEIDLSTSSS